MSRPISSRALTREIARQINFLNKAAHSQRTDGWTNALTGMGVSGKDKRWNTSFYGNDMLQEDELNAIYINEGIGHRIIEVLVEDMTRKWFTVSGDTDNTLEKELKKFRGKSALKEGLRWGLLHGGAVGIMGIDDGGLYEEPVNEDRIVSISHIHVFDRWRAVWTTADLYVDPESPKFATPEYYTIFPINPATVGATQQFNASTSPTTGGDRAPRAVGVKGKLAPAIGAFRVHESRILRFDGMPLPLRDRIRNRYWNASELQPLYERLKGLGESFSNMESIISEFVQGVMSVEGLGSMLAGGKDGATLLQKRLDLLEQTSHVLNTRIIDKEEVYQRMGSPTSGLDALVDRLFLGISATKGIPEMVLFGKSVGGLGANDETNLRRYYDKITAMQVDRLEEPLEKLVRYMSLSSDGGLKLKDKEDWTIEFPPLWALTEKDEVMLRSTMATADTGYINAGVLTPEEVAKSRFGGDEYTYETKLSEERDEDGFLPQPATPEVDENGQPLPSDQGPIGAEGGDQPAAAGGPPEEGYLAQYAKNDEADKGNPNHSSDNGQFASGGGSSHKEGIEPGAAINSKKIANPPKEKLTGKLNMDAIRDYVDKKAIGRDDEVENPANVPSDEAMAKLTESKLVGDDGYATTKEAGEAFSKGKYQKIPVDKVASIQGHVYGSKLLSASHAMNRGSFTPSSVVKDNGGAPIMAYKVGNEYLLMDGNHRFAAQKLSGMKDVHAFIAEVPMGKSKMDNWDQWNEEHKNLHRQLNASNKLSFGDREKLHAKIQQHEYVKAHLEKMAAAKTEAEKKGHAENATTAAIKAHGKTPDKKAVRHISGKLSIGGGGHGALSSLVRKYYNEVEKETNPDA